ncbi:glycoside hydrolase family 3 N-terminal domain-containing protein [Thalassotalea fonticola]|uniref:beta-glucosidase n=1 Tax=Thalassotalea fonticola TaxID=3065649 RepID=A0ABZ0GQX0_9GAMM|nr:glycoside hydrolase family 3 N-terminal domain-containing protein [Colwelliaceae bacterium S1-1]
MNKWLKYSAIAVAVPVSLVALGVAKTYWLDTILAKADIGPEAPTLNTSGFNYRDLNKNGELDVYEDSRQPISRRVDDLVAQMNIEEKAGLMFQPPMTFGDNAEILEDMNMSMGYGTYDIINSRLINHFNVMGSAPVASMARWHNDVQKLAEQTRLGIPITFSTDPRHSLRDGKNATSVRTEGFSLWPEPIGFGAIGDENVAEEFGRIANIEYRAVGIRLALHPMADLATEPRWARSVGTFGEEAELSSKLVAGYIKGFQGANIGNSSVLTMVKHFPGGGPQANGLDAHQFYGADQAYPGDNFDYHLKPFKAAFDVGAAQVMPYYGIPNGQTSEDVAMSFNKEVITDMLRGDFGFEGVVCTDWGIITDKGAMGWVAMRARAWGVEGLSESDRFKKALDAGVDQFGGEELPGFIVDLVEDGEVSIGRINASVRRILKDKFRLGLFDNPYVDVALAEKIAGTDEFMKAGALAQRKSLVLLKNKPLENQQQEQGYTLPLAKGVKVYLEGVDENVASRYAQVVTNLADADVAILRVKAPHRAPRTDLNMGENIIETILNQGDLDFKGEELAHINEVMATKPTIVSIYLERPSVIPEIAKHAVGVLAEFGATDDAIFDVLFGDFNPTGKLPFEMPRSMAAVEAQFEDVPFDSVDPLFSFGHGLSYQE